MRSTTIRDVFQLLCIGEWTPEILRRIDTDKVGHSFAVARCMQEPARGQTADFRRRSISHSGRLGLLRLVYCLNAIENTASDCAWRPERHSRSVFHDEQAHASATSDVELRPKTFIQASIPSGSHQALRRLGRCWFPTLGGGWDHEMNQQTATWLTWQSQLLS